LENAADQQGIHVADLDHAFDDQGQHVYHEDEMSTLLLSYLREKSFSKNGAVPAPKMAPTGRAPMRIPWKELVVAFSP
jgi:hypothetical protein